MSLSHHSAAAA